MCRGIFCTSESWFYTNVLHAAATEALSAADDLSHQSEKLRADVNTFLGQIRAA
jgi:hypothetical protein